MKTSLTAMSIADAAAIVTSLRTVRSNSKLQFKVAKVAEEKTKRKRATTALAKPNAKLNLASLNPDERAALIAALRKLT